MTNEEAKEIMEDLKYSLDISLIGTLEINEIDNAMVIAIKALEQQPCEDCISRNNKRTICTDGLEEGIRCAMCTNPMANDRGCDGGCVVNESMYQNVLNVIKKHFLEQQPCEDAISRKDMLAIFRQSNSLSQAWNGFEKLPSVTPKEKSEYEHDHEVVKAYNDGQAYILDKIRAEIENDFQFKQFPRSPWSCGLRRALEIIDKYREVSE